LTSPADDASIGNRRIERLLEHDLPGNFTACHISPDLCSS
jgi:hypothetical protein